MSNFSVRFSFLSGAIALILAQHAQAGSAPVPQPTVTVTATGVAETVDESLSSVTVIDRDAIEKSHAQDVLELLRLSAGIDIARSGGPGQSTSVFLRGGNSNHVLVLIDGVRVASSNTGAFLWEQLPTAQIERIEIVRGPRASRWGSDALGGVIQVFTRKLTGPLVAVGYGSYADVGAEGGYGARGERGAFSIALNARNVDGFSAQTPDGYAYDPDQDPYRNRALSANGEVELGGQTLSASVLRSEGELAFDQGQSEMLNQALALTLSGALRANWQHRLALSQAREDLETPDFFSLFLTRREALSWQNEFALSGAHTLLAGLDFVHDDGENRDTFSDTPVYAESRRNVGVFALWRAQRNNFDWELSGRYDDNSEFGGEATGGAAFGWQWNANGRLTAAYGQGFRAPTLNEQFSPGYGGLFAGFPDLDPERSRTFEIGADYQCSDTLRFKTRLYRTRVQDLIAFSGGETFQAENIARAAIDGAELEVFWNSGPWRSGANFTFQDARDADADTALLRRARQKMNTTLDYAFSNLSLGAELAYAGRRADFAGELGSYTLVNLRATWVLAPAWSVEARVDNLFDRDYVLIDGFATADRSGWLGLRWEPR